MKVLELFSGNYSLGRAALDMGHDVTGVDILPCPDDLIGRVKHHQTDILEWEYENITWDFDFIWGSPVCTTYSVGGFPKGHRKNGLAASDLAHLHDSYVKKAIEIIRDMLPFYWILENPDALLKKQPFMKRLPFVTVTYCQYGDTRQKRTNLFGNIPESFIARACNNGDTCHRAGPRGSKDPFTTQGLPKEKRSEVPWKLCFEIINSIERDMISGGIE